MIRSGKNGFAMIEVLIAILVVAVGVIGAAGMQLAALRAARQTAYHSAALQLASEMADAIRASAGRLPGGAHAFWDIDYLAGGADQSPPVKLCYVEACEVAEFAAFELHEWRQRMQAALPGARMRICRDAAAWDEARKTLRWECDAASDGDAPLMIKLGWHAGAETGDASAPVMALTVNPLPR